MDALLSTDGLNELQDTWRRFDLHYAGARPWGEFFEQFKPTARDLDTRMATNWLHYKANYAQLTTLVVALGLLWWPTSLFALCVAAIASTACVGWLSRRSRIQGRRVDGVPGLGSTAAGRRRRNDMGRRKTHGTDLHDVITDSARAIDVRIS